MRAIRRRDVLAAPLVALAVTACGGRQDSGKTAAILLRGNGPDPDSLDQHKARSTEAMVVLRDLFECLTRLDKNAVTIPAAAESWSTSITPNSSTRSSPARPASSCV